MACELHSYIIKMQLWGNQLRATPIRIELLDIFEHVKKPLNISQLEKELAHLIPDKTTLYRTVESLTKEGMLRKINFGAKEQYFELASGKHHHHIVCSRCKKIEDIPDCDLSDYYKAFSKKTGFAEINEHSLEFFGICQNCVYKPKK